MKQSVMERNAIMLLEYLASRASRSSRSAVVPYRMMMADLNMSQSRVRRLVNLLGERGYIKVCCRFAEDGGGLANEYRITARGLAALQTYAQNMLETTS